MPSKRCTVCAIEWPVAMDYTLCPQCLEATWLHSSGEPIDRADALHLKNVADQRRANQAAFEAYYEERNKAALVESLDAIRRLPEAPKPQLDPSPQPHVKRAEWT